MHDNSTDNTISVFIGIKTGETGLYGVRSLPEIQKTWLQDAIDMGVNINFFADKSDPNNSTKPEASSGNAKTKENRFNSSGLVDMDPLMVPVPVDRKSCRGYPPIVCKTAYMFDYFLHHDKNTSSFFCNFDDDNYVLVQNLLRVL